MSDQPKHIGIMAITAEGAALLYRTICQEAPKYLRKHAHPEISLHSFSFAEYMAPSSDKIERWGELMRQSAQKLVNMGAELIVCPANTNHEVYGRIAPLIPVPWIHIASVVADEISAKGFRHAGLLGTKFTMQGSIYSKVFSKRGFELSVPNEDAQEELNRIIYDELIAGEIVLSSQAFIFAQVVDLQSRGCDCVILGCTELPLAISQADSPTPLLDSTRLLAHGALAHSLGMASVDVTAAAS